MRLSEFDYELPNELIAQFPIKPRENANLLDASSSQIFDKHVYNLPDLINSNDILIVNNTKVLPSKLLGRIKNKDIIVTLHKNTSQNTWLAFSKPSKLLQNGDCIIFDGFEGIVIEKLDFGEIEIDFDISYSGFINKLTKIGQMPLPPYIKRKNIRNEDFDDYQTNFSSKIGSVASPTAGLHFSKKLISDLSLKKIKISEITLHIGAGTFLPIRSNDINHHVMHYEWGELSQKVVNDIIKCKKNGGRVIAVGTTTLRMLETAFQNQNKLVPFSGSTNLFIKPGFDIKTVDLLLTNFHMPKSTLFILVSTFSGVDKIKKIYNHAIQKKYRFFSYGDCCLLRNSNETFSI